ncbi:MAG: hypothetical protein AAGE18_05395 [Pseudomonadota bacterium]
MNLADSLFDDLFETSDEDILKEVSEDGDDPEALAGQLRSQAEAALLQSRKERRLVARNARLAAQNTPTTDVLVDVSVARQALRGAFQNNDLSMAARNETESELTDEEVSRKYRDLVRLGVIQQKDDGKGE